MCLHIQMRHCFSARNAVAKAAGLLLKGADLKREGVFVVQLHTDKAPYPLACLHAASAASFIASGREG